MLENAATLEVLTEVIQGVIAAALVAILGIIAIIETLAGRPFSEPTTLAALAGAAVGFYYGQRNQRRQQDVIHDLSTRLANNGKETQ